MQQIAEGCEGTGQLAFGVTQHGHPQWAVENLPGAGIPVPQSHASRIHGELKALFADAQALFLTAHPVSPCQHQQQHNGSNRHDLGNLLIVRPCGKLLAAPAVEYLLCLTFADGIERPVQQRHQGFELRLHSQGEARIKFCPANYAYIVYAQLADVVTRLRQSGQKCVDLAGRYSCQSVLNRIDYMIVKLRVFRAYLRNVTVIPDHCDTAAGDLVDIVDESLGFLHHDNHRT